MRANSFATLVSILNDVPVASHIPLVVTVENGVVKLSGHLAKPNPQWQGFGVGETLAVFTLKRMEIRPHNRTDDFCGEIYSLKVPKDLG